MDCRTESAGPREGGALRSARAFGISLGIALCLGAAVAASAEPVDGKAARKLVFKPKGAEVTVIDLPFLSEADRKGLVFAGEQQPYYGAIAVAPSEGLISEATLAAANYHD
ncbi:hypothetical protein JMJ92_21615, partial [Rhodovulum visakhapatnamense]|nr:hypothetical protein [Rhodovulum visakhapatnamense]